MTQPVAHPKPEPPPLTERQQRASLLSQQRALVRFVESFQVFVQLGFWGRVRWLLFGAKTFLVAPPALGELRGARLRERV